MDIHIHIPTFVLWILLGVIVGGGFVFLVVMEAFKRAVGRAFGW